MFIDPYLGSVTPFAGNFAPLGWAFCDGSLLAIADNNALFALIGTTYGGDGQTTFALPDLRSRVPVHVGQGPGLSDYQLGQMSGSESVTLTSANLPMHNHAVISLTNTNQPYSTATTGGGNIPTSSYPSSGAQTFTNQSPGGELMNTYSCMGATAIAGSSTPVSIIQPYQSMNFIIAVEGIFPSRN